MSAALSWLLGGWRPGVGALAFGVGGVGLAGLAALALGLPLLAWISARRQPRAWLQAALLLPASAGLAWALAAPRLVERSGVWEAGRFVVLVDDSASMAVLEGSRPRADAVASALAAVGRPDAERLRFGAGLAPGGTTAFLEPGTDLGLALRALADRYAGERLAGIAVVTDGVDRGGLRAAFLAGEPMDLPALPGPVTVYGVGDAGALVDLSVASVSAGGFAFLRTPFAIRAAIAGARFGGRRVPVTLSCDGSLVARQTVTLDAEGRAEVRFEVTPTAAGRHVWRVEVPGQPGDAVPGNDAASIVVRVVRDRLRVLQVCGSPAMDENFLRRFLKQDPAIDLVSFFILRTHEDMAAGYGDDELALIPFPYEQLFEEDLSSFDLVVFQNFDYAPYFGFQGENLLRNLADWVRAGGAFLMIGGDRSFDLGGYGSTPLADALPVRLGLAGGAAVDLAPFRPALTEAGRLHPVTALASDPAENEALWAALAPLDGLNRTLGSSAGAVVLLEHPTLRTAEGRAVPVLAVRAVGAGRSMAFTADASWRWAFAEAGKGGTNLAYLRFWKHALRWLVGDPEAQRVTLATTRENYGLGEEVRVTVRARDPAFKPQEGVRLRGRVIAPDLAAASALAAPGLDAEGRFELASASDGMAGIALPAAAPGAWRVAVEALDGDGRAFFSGETVFAVTERLPELEDLGPDHAFLAALAAQAGGRFLAPGAWGSPLEDPEARTWVEQVGELPLGPIPAVGILIGLFAPLSWWVRRRAGGR